MPTKPLQQKITKPTQAGSSRSLDRWTKELRVILPRVAYLHAELRRLLASMQKAERR